MEETFGEVLPATGRLRDFHPRERAPTGRTRTMRHGSNPVPHFCVMETMIEKGKQERYNMGLLQNTPMRKTTSTTPKGLG